MLLRGGRLRPERVGLHQHAVERLHCLIIRGELAPGVPLVESDLAEALGVSRTPLREALKLLAAEGLIELRPNRSARVRPMRASEISDLFEAVSGIERLAAELAAERITRNELIRLEQFQSRMERLHGCGDLDGYFNLNQQIHLLVVRAAKNRSLQEAHAALLGRAERARYFALSSRSRWDQSVEEHRQVLDALRRGDVFAAGIHLRDHVLRTGLIVNAALQRADDAGDKGPNTALEVAEGAAA
ncbi:MAG: GntR family transcriptional regulator [Beijerinckiaceae bacterium]